MWKNIKRPFRYFFTDSDDDEKIKALVEKKTQKLFLLRCKQGPWLRGRNSCSRIKSKGSNLVGLTYTA